MKNSEFTQQTIYWLDRFISTHDRDPKTYTEFTQFVMDTMTDEGEV